MVVEAHYGLSDDSFEKQFKACAIDSSVFTHEAHLRLAWIHIRKYGVEKAIDNICQQLFNYVYVNDARDKFNKTLTVAAINAVNHFIKRTKADTFFQFINLNPRLKYNFRGIIAAHYQVDIYKSAIAKEVYLEPDLLPFS